KMISHGVVVDLGYAPFLRPDATGKIPQMVDRQRNIGSHGFAQWLAIIDGIGNGQYLQILLHLVSHTPQDIGSFGSRRFPPLLAGGVCRIKRKVNISRIGARHLAKYLASYWRDIFKIIARHGSNPTSAYVVFVMF